MDWKKPFKRKETSILLVVVLLSTAITLVNGTFLTFQNITDILRSYAVHGIVAMGMLLVIVTAGIDVSVGSMAAAVSVVLGNYMIRFGGNLFTVLLVSSLAGVVFGLINGFFIAQLRIPAIVVTLGTLSVFRGAELYVTGGSWITGLPDWFIDFGRTKVAGVPIQIFFWLFAGVLTWLILNYTRFGRGVFALGGNPEAASRVGYKNRRTLLLVWAYLGFMVGMASMVHTSIVRHVDPNAFSFFELTVIAACVIGGANIMGGEGTVIGTFLGVLILAIVENGLILTHISAYWHQIIIGGVILSAVTVDVVQIRRREKNMAKIDIELFRDEKNGANAK